MRKLILVFIALVLVPLPVLARGTSFRDVPASHFAYDAINWVSDPENGAIMVGNARNNFRPSAASTKFEAAQIFAIAAGFRPINSGVSTAQRDEFNRAFETWRVYIESMNSVFTRWDTRVDREISFLLYRSILTPADVLRFMSNSGQNEQPAYLTRQEGLTWLVRLMGRGAHAQALQIPHHTPFRDDDQIDPALKRYVYYAKEAGIATGSGGYLNPLEHYTRAELASLLYSVLSVETNDDSPLPPQNPGLNTISGTISDIIRDTHIEIDSGTGREAFAVADNATIMIEGRSRPIQALEEDMFVSALLNQDRQIISLVVTPPPPEPPVSEEEPTDEDVYDNEDSFDGELVEILIREDSDYPLLMISDEYGRVFELDITSETVFTRDGEDSGLADLRIGDAIAAEAEYDRILTVHATGSHSTIDGRLAAIAITEYYTELMIANSDGISFFYVVPGEHDVVGLRIGSWVRLSLESREVTNIQLLVSTDQAGVAGYIGRMYEDTITVHETCGSRTRTLTLTPDTVVWRGPVRVGRGSLRTDMNVYVSLTDSDSSEAALIRVLP